jgi:hypothetical protein
MWQVNIHQLFFFFVSFSLLFISFFLFLKCRRWRQAWKLVLICLFFFSDVANDGEPLWLIIILFFLMCNRWRQTSLARRHFFVFFLRCSRWRWASLAHCHFFVFFLKCNKWRRARRLPTCCHFMGFFSSVSSLATSPPNASLLYLHVCGDVTTPWQMQR